MLTDRQKHFEERVASSQHPAAEGTELQSIPEEFAARSHTAAPGATLFPNTGWLGNCPMLVDDDVALVVRSSVLLAGNICRDET